LQAFNAATPGRRGQPGNTLELITNLTGCGFFNAGTPGRWGTAGNTVELNNQFHQLQFFERWDAGVLGKYARNTLKSTPVAVFQRRDAGALGNSREIPVELNKSISSAAVFSTPRRRNAGARGNSGKYLRTHN